MNGDPDIPDYCAWSFNCYYYLVSTVDYQIAQPAAGDVDYNGLIESADAPIFMRGAMSIIELDPARTVVADVDGNGIVQIADALVILRTAMDTD